MTWAENGAGSSKTEQRGSVCLCVIVEGLPQDIHVVFLSFGSVVPQK